MEFFIVIVALLSAGGGGIILLSCLAYQKSHLLKALEIELDAEARDEQIRKSVAKEKKLHRHHREDIPLASNTTDKV